MDKSVCSSCCSHCIILFQVPVQNRLPCIKGEEQRTLQCLLQLSQLCNLRLPQPARRQVCKHQMVLQLCLFQMLMCNYRQHSKQSPSQPILSQACQITIQSHGRRLLCRCAVLSDMLARRYIQLSCLCCPAQHAQQTSKSCVYLLCVCPGVCHCAI